MHDPLKQVQAGYHYGKLYVISRAGRIDGDPPDYWWVCRCTCRSQVSVRGSLLISARKLCCDACVPAEEDFSEPYTKEPQPQRAISFPTKEDVKSLLAEMMDKQVSQLAFGMLARLAANPHVVRMTFNLQRMLVLIASKHIDRLLGDGLLPDEKRVLLELDAKGLSSAARGVAHGLFNLHERWVLLKSVAKAYREAKNWDLKGETSSDRNSRSEDEPDTDIAARVPEDADRLE